MIKLEELSYNDEVVLTIGVDENDNSLVLVDKNKNLVKLGVNGISFKSDKDINIEAGQNLTLKGVQGVTITSSPGDVTIKGMNIKQSADTQFSAEGSATAELKGGAQTTIKGAMVMIN